LTAATAPPSRLEALSVDDLIAFDRIGALSLSPDGSRLVCSVSRGSLQTNRFATCLWLLSTDGGAAPRQLTRCGDRDGQPAWSPCGQRIAFLAQRQQQGVADASPQIYLIAADGGEATRASSFAPGIESFKWMPDGQRIVFAAWVWPQLKGAAAQARQHQAFSRRQETGYATSQAYHRFWDHPLPMGRVLHLWLLDLRTGRMTDLFQGADVELPRDASGCEVYDPHPDGQRIAFVHDPVRPMMPSGRQALATVDVATRQVRPLVDDPAWDCGAPSYRPDGSALAFTAAQVGRHHTALNRLALVEPAAVGAVRGAGPGAGAGAGSAWRLLDAGDADLHVEAPLRWADVGRSVLFTAESRGRRPLWRHDLASGRCAVVQPGGWVLAFGVAREGGAGAGSDAYVDVDADADVIVTASDTAQHPARLHALRTGAAPRRLDRFNDALLARRTLGRVEEITVTGAGGQPVQVWLTFPPGFDRRRKHPVLQVIHGGPFAAAGDTFSYRWNPHVLAARGHVVAQVNYHGSSGFGWAFRHSIMGRQGQLECQDIEAASDWLLAQPWADRRRLAAAGGSYGGMLVAWMNGQVPAGRYRAYVCHAGVFDRIASFSADSCIERPRDLGARYWEDLPKVLAQSPHAAAARMATPTLVIHGARDYRVPDCNGLAYYNTLKARGVEARLLWFPDENHWVQKPFNSKQWYGELLDWVEAHDRPGRKKPPKPPKPPAAVPCVVEPLR
jgi:dipeptidyl aminopeptidase/acylaminoacyl peptidase